MKYPLVVWWVTWSTALVYYRDILFGRIYERFSVCYIFYYRDILFGRIYERFSADVIAMGTFLECLEPYILGDKLTSIPPSVMKDFVDHYQSRGMLESVEACIVHLEVTSLDIHQVGSNL